MSELHLPLRDALESECLHDRVLAVATAISRVEGFTRMVSLLLAGLAAKTSNDQDAKDLIAAAVSVDDVTNWLSLECAFLIQSGQATATVHEQSKSAH